MKFEACKNTYNSFLTYDEIYSPSNLWDIQCVQPGKPISNMNVYDMRYTLYIIWGGTWATLTF